MKRLIAFPTEDGSSIVVEVDEEPPAGAVRASRSDEVVDRAQETFEAALSMVRPAAEVLVARLRDLSDQPSEVSVEFGVKLSAEAGAIIAETGAEANFRVTLSWTQRST